MTASREAQFRKIFAVIFVVVGLVIAMWQANTVWSISHKCQCGLAYGASQGDYSGAQTLRSALIFVPFAIALAVNPLAGLIASILELVYVVILQLGILQTIAETENPYWQFMRNSTWVFVILSGVALLTGIFFFLWRRGDLSPAKGQK